MALKDKSLFTYGFQVNQFTSSLDFKTDVTPGIEKRATLKYGFYSLTSLMAEVVRALTEIDPTSIYTTTIIRNMAGGTQNRVGIKRNGQYLNLLFGSGSRVSSSVGPLLGYSQIDLSATDSFLYSQASAGTTLIPEYIGYTYVSPDQMRKVQGSVNVSAAGLKESVVFAVQRFIEVDFRYEPIGKVNTQWVEFWDWACQQRAFEFTPEISSPDVIYEVTLESTGADGKGLGYFMSEMLPEFPNNYKTGKIKMRQKVSSQFLS